LPSTCSLHFLQANSNLQLAVAWPNNQLEASQPSGMTEKQHQQHCRLLDEGLPSQEPLQLSAMATDNGHSRQSEPLITIQPEAASPIASASASQIVHQDAAEQHLLHNGQNSPLSTMEVLALLFPKEQSSAAAALLPTALTIQHSGAAVTLPPATAAAPPAKTAAPTAAPIASAPTTTTTDDSAAADHLAPAAASVLAPSLNAKPATTAAAAAAAADAERGPATAAATDTGGAVAAPLPLSTAASLFATTAPAAMARSATAAKAADGANDSTVEASTGRTPLHSTYSMDEKPLILVALHLFHNRTTEHKVTHVTLPGFKDHHFCLAEIDCKLMLFTEAC